MSENKVDTSTFSGYLNKDFQQKVLWQLITDSAFASDIIDKLHVSYFDTNEHKRFYSVIKQYYQEYERIPLLYDRSINHAVDKYKIKDDEIDGETLNEIRKSIEAWDTKLLNSNEIHDGKVIQKEIYSFIRQQESKHLSAVITKAVADGKTKDNEVLDQLIDQMSQIRTIGQPDNIGSNLQDSIEETLAKDYRKPIRTGLDFIDIITGGGLGKGQVGVILAPSGVGKSTILSRIAAQAYTDRKNVLHIFFEDIPEEIKRKHFSFITDVPISSLEYNKEFVTKKIIDFTTVRKNILHTAKFSQDGTTVAHIRSYMNNYEKLHNMKFDIIILDYIDEVESNRKGEDENTGQKTVIKQFMALADDKEIPAWTAVQSNRGGFNSDSVDQKDMGGSIKRVHKSHFLMSISKTEEQKQNNTANINILKCRFAKDGFRFTDAIFNNDTLEIRVTDPIPNWKLNVKKYNQEDIEKINNQISSFKDNSDNDISDEFFSGDRDIEEESNGLENENNSKINTGVTLNYESSVIKSSAITETNTNQYKKQISKEYSLKNLDDMWNDPANQEKIYKALYGANSSP